MFASAAAWRAFWARTTAVLSFDSAAPAPGVMAARSTGSGASRHLLFSVEGRDIDLRVQAPATDGSHTLAGQVLGPDETGRIELLLADTDTTVATTDLSALGEFNITGVAPGRYDLLLQLGDDAVALPTIDVGNSAA